MSRTIYESSKIRNNNLNLIRFIAATLVIISHSFPITQGDNSNEILYILTHGQEKLGSLSVKIFFIVSGFLITQSWYRKNNIKDFIKARILRIFPALIISLFITVFIIGLICTNLTKKEYLSNINTYKYLTSISLIKIQYELPGVFDNNILKGVVNGSLWTLYYEFICYCLVAILGRLSILKKYCIIFFSITFTLSILKSSNFLLLTSYFFVGSLIYIYRSKIKLDFKIFILSLISTFVFGYCELLKIILPFTLSYIVMYLAFNKNIKMYKFGTKNDVSYGLYIYSFPIQQMIVHYLKNMPWYYNFISSFIITLLISYISWNLVEKPIMKYK